MKKIIAIMMVLVMMMAVTVPAFAATIGSASQQAGDATVLTDISGVVGEGHTLNNQLSLRSAVGTNGAVTVIGSEGDTIIVHVFRVILIIQRVFIRLGSGITADIGAVLDHGILDAHSHNGNSGHTDGRT